MDAQVENDNRLAKKFKRDLPAFKVTEKIANEIDDMRENQMRAFKALGNERMQERHKAKVRRMLTLETNSFTIEELLKLGVTSKVDEIEDCSNTATKESN